jgi:AraC-like DNA-binding protein
MLRLIRMRYPDEWAYKGEALSFFFLKGGVDCHVSGSIAQRISPGGMMILPGDAGGKICVSEKGEIVFWVFSVCLEHLFPLFASHEISLLRDVTENLRSPKVYPPSHPVALQCHRLLREIPPQFGLDHRSHLLRVAAVVLTEEFKTARRQHTGFVRVEERMLEVFEKLSAKELMTLSVGELASKFGCSRRHLNRLFHSYFGLSMATLRIEMRLLKAVALLRDPSTKVINVAEQCGFNHLGLFNSCFKRRFGASPGRWRKLNSQTEGPSSGLKNDGSTCPLRLNHLCPWNDKLEEPHSAVRKKDAHDPQQGARALTDRTVLQKCVGDLLQECVGDQALGIQATRTQAEPPGPSALRIGP